jgi:hypothetical protein
LFIAAADAMGGAEGLTVSAVAGHVAAPAQIHAHLLLALERLSEQQGVIISLNKKVHV